CNARAGPARERRRAGRRRCPGSAPAGTGSASGTRRLAKRRRGPKLVSMTMPSDSPLALARTRLLAPAGLDPAGLERAFGALLGPGIDFGDLYFQHARREAWTVEDGIVKDGAHSIEQGVGVRAISGEKTGFAYSDDINGDALLASARSARAIAREGDGHVARTLVPGQERQLYVPQDPIDALGNDTKVEALRRIDRLLRAADPRVQ